MNRVLLTTLLLTIPLSAHALSGTVQAENGTPLPYTYVGLMSQDFLPLAYAITDTVGAFTIQDNPAQALLVVQPPAKPHPSGVQAFTHQPRIYALGATDIPLGLKLPPAVTLVIEAYDPQGKIMRWEDFTRLGEKGGQFLYAADTNDASIPATYWPVHGNLIGADSGPREKGLPAVLLKPGQLTVVNPLFWLVPNYGKFLLPADNGGLGFALTKPGDARRIHLNYELARSAVTALKNRSSEFASTAHTEIAALDAKLQTATAIADPIQKASFSDVLLADALSLRDRFELDRARANIAAIRQGTLEIKLSGADNPETYAIAVNQQRHDFLFGVFEGSPYNAKAFTLAREAGFELATVLLGWNWTQNPRTTQSATETTFGIARLNALGYRLKAHGVLWMQDYGILPEFAKTLPHADLLPAALAHQNELLDTFSDSIDLWEAMNEPANVNVVGLPRDAMINLVQKAAANIHSKNRPVLLNSPHEFNHGAQYLLYNTDNTPVESYTQTFSSFLDSATTTGALDDIDILGLQFYPGFHFSEAFGNQQGPAFTPAYILDTLNRYTRFGKTIHITELSLPSRYDSQWYAGYWREPWTEETQADYAEAIYTIAFAHPQVQSIGWWDIMDTKPSVISGGLVRQDGTPKPVLERIRTLILQWTTQTNITPDDQGRSIVNCFGGDYEIVITAPDGTTITQNVHLQERNTTTLNINLGNSL